MRGIADAAGWEREPTRRFALPETGRPNLLMSKLRYPQRGIEWDESQGARPRLTKSVRLQQSSITVAFMKLALTVPIAVLTASISSVSTVSSGPALAEELMIASTPVVRVSVNVGAVSFDGPDCANVPVNVNYVRLGPRRDDIDLIVSLDLRQPGSNTSSATYPRVVISGTSSGAIQDALQVCPEEYSEEAGDFDLSGSISSYSFDDGITFTSSFDSRTRPVIKNQTVVQQLELKGNRKRRYTLYGKATAATPSRGDVGAASTVTIFAKVPNARNWRQVATVNTDNFGRWTQQIGSLPKGTKVRVDLSDCLWCTDSSQTITIRK